jgi:isopenicillin-N N-acyltransferase-like protein
MGPCLADHALPQSRRSLPSSIAQLLAACALLTILASNLHGQDDKATRLRGGPGSEPASTPTQRFVRPDVGSDKGRLVMVGEGDARLPVVVVRGTPYAMGRQVGDTLGEPMRAFVPSALAGITRELGLSQEDLAEVWARTAAYTDDRFEQELAGLADGSGLPLALLQALHAVPLLMPYSCSSIAAWGSATEDGHLYQTRNLDWSLAIKAHEVPAIVVYLPDRGVPHVVPTFAGSIGAHTGLNLRGIALSEMGDASAREMPYQVHAPHFTTWFRALLYDADSLTRALEIFQAQPLTKRYHFVFGDGRKERRAVKIRAHSPEPPDRRVLIWKDGDRSDEFAPNVLPGVVYNDEGRGAFPTLKAQHGRLNGERLVQLANQIPIKGGNVMNVVYDATALRLWVSYAKGSQEAYQRPYVFLDLTRLDADGDGRPDLSGALEAAR